MARIVALQDDDMARLLLQHWAAGGHTTATGVAQLDDATVVLLNSKTITDDLARIAGRFAGKTVIECSNADGISELRSRASIAEDIAGAMPDANIVKAFNVITPETLRVCVERAGPETNSAYTAGYFCGDDAKAKVLVASLMEEVNLDPIDCGPLSNAVLLESLGVLGKYFEEHVFGPLFSIDVVRKPKDRSPLDRFM